MAGILISRVVTVAEFITYLLAKKVESKCPSCGHESAFVSADTDGNTAAQTKLDVAKFNLGTMGVSPTSAGTVLALSTICDNCGFIRSYAAQNVYEWLDKQQGSST